MSDLLWAAYVITKEETKSSKSRRTDPSATKSQEIKVYLALEHGLYLYCEATQLNTVVFGLVDRKRLHKLMDLEEREKVVYT